MNDAVPRAAAGSAAATTNHLSDLQDQLATTPRHAKPRAQHVRRSAQLLGLQRPAPPDLQLRPWPADCVVIVAATPDTINVRGIRGEIRDARCADCDVRLCVDSVSITTALAMPEREGRPLRTICVRCFRQYDRRRVLIIDNRPAAAAAGVTTCAEVDADE